MHSGGRARRAESLAPFLTTKALDLDIVAINMMMNDVVVLLTVIVVGRPSKCDDQLPCHVL